MAQQRIPPQRVECKNTRSGHSEAQRIPLDLAHSVRHHHHRHLHGDPLLQQRAWNPGRHRVLAVDGVLSCRDVHPADECEEMEPQVRAPPGPQLLHSFNFDCWVDWRCGGYHPTT